MFRAATYNVLATAYLSKGDYSAVPPGLLDPAWRVPAVVRRVVGLNADVVCLQEVEADLFAALEAHLGPLGFAGRHELKSGRPDGCATFYRAASFAPVRAARLEYRDEGFVALLLTLEHEGRPLGVANTHLRWDRPGTPRAEQVGFRQASELLDALDPACDAWVVCGDFNRGPASEVPAAFRAAGLVAAHQRLPAARSAVMNRRATLIDYVFHSRTLVCVPDAPPTPPDALPSAEEPSDHLPLTATFAWGPG